MIDNLTEAIAHAKEKAEELNAHADYYKKHDMPEYLPSCLDCAKEHEQLAAWLTELQERREADRWIPVSEKLPEKDGYYLVTRINNDMEIVLFTHNFGFAWSNVIAWRHLPEAYKESEAENETNN